MRDSITERMPLGRLCWLMAIQLISQELLPMQMQKHLPLTMTSKLIVVTEIDLTQGCEHTRYFVFPLDGDSDFCYRSRVSHDAFFSSPKGRNYFPTKRNAKLLYHAQDEFNFFLGSAAKAVPEQAVRLNSLWDFYEAIGYDYKQKKWSKL